MYDDLLADFNQKLVTQLRGHGAGSEYLESWVPDDDPVMSMLNMVEAGISGGLGQFCVRFGRETMNDAQRRALMAAVCEIAEAKIDETDNGYQLDITSSK